MPGQGNEKNLFGNSETKNQCRLCGNFRLFTLDVFNSFVKLSDSGLNDPLASCTSIPLLQLINEYLNIDVKKNANLPVHICKKCCNQLTTWYSFKSACLNQQIKFNAKCSVADTQENNKSPLCNEISFENADYKVGDISDGKGGNVGNFLKKINEKLEISEAMKGKGYLEESTDKKGNSSTGANNESGLLRDASIRNISYNLIKAKVKVSKSKKKNVDQNIENIFQCNECSKIFHSKYSIRKHLKTHGSHEYCCHLCGMLFKAASTLRYHLHLHSGKKKFSCPHCSKEFHQTNHLNQHIRIHTGERPYSCSECEQKFTRSSQLRRHVMAIHRKEHKYKCDLCGKGFLSNSNFKAHILRHSKQRNVKCDVCEKSFVTRNELFRHLRTHTGDKPFPCHECGLRFADCSNRKKHMINCHSLPTPNNTIANSSAISKNKETTEGTEEKLGNAYKVKNGDSAIKSFVEPQIVLLTPVNLKTNVTDLSKSEENLIDSSNLSCNKNNVYLNLNNLQIIDQSENKSNENHSEVLIRNNVALTGQDSYEESHIYVSNVTGNVHVPENFTVSEIVQDTEQLEIPFSDDLPIFNSLAECAAQGIAYIINEKEIFAQSDIIAQNIAYNQIDIESNYLGFVESEQKSSGDAFRNVESCETQSIMKVLNNEDTVLLFSE